MFGEKERESSPQLFPGIMFVVIAILSLMALYEAKKVIAADGILHDEMSAKIVLLQLCVRENDRLELTGKLEPNLALIMPEEMGPLPYTFSVNTESGVITARRPDGKGRPIRVNRYGIFFPDGS